MRTDRRRVGWREFRHSYPGLVVTMAIAVAIFLAADAWLFVRYRRYVRETGELRASMTDVERTRTDALLAQEENRLKVMVELFRRQAKVDPARLAPLRISLTGRARTPSAGRPANGMKRRLSIWTTL